MDKCHFQHLSAGRYLLAISEKQYWSLSVHWYLLSHCCDKQQTKVTYRRIYSSSQREGPRTSQQGQHGDRSRVAGSLCSESGNRDRGTLGAGHPLLFSQPRTPTMECAVHIQGGFSYSSQAQKLLHWHGQRFVCQVTISCQVDSINHHPLGFVFVIDEKECQAEFRSQMSVGQGGNASMQRTLTFFFSIRKLTLNFCAIS